MKQSTIIVIAALLSGCGGSSNSSDTDSVYIYDTDLIRGCNWPNNETLQESAAILIYAGIDVLSSSCGNITGVAWHEACSSPTGQINVHLIRRENVIDAIPLGYDSTENIDSFTPEEGFIDGALGYEIIDC